MKTVQTRAQQGWYWSSSGSTEIRAYRLYFNVSEVYLNDPVRLEGNSLRCVAHGVLGITAVSMFFVYLRVLLGKKL